MAARIVVLVAVGVLVAVAAILILAATKPDGFRIERSMTIQASAERIFPLIMTFMTGASGRLRTGRIRRSNGPIAGRRAG